MTRLCVLWHQEEVIYSRFVALLQELFGQLVDDSCHKVQHANGTVSLTMLPQKFQRLIWIKRGALFVCVCSISVIKFVIDDYLIVTLGDRDRKNANKGAVTSIVLHILYKKQVKHLKDKKLWYALSVQQVHMYFARVPFSRPKEFEHAESGPCVELGDAVMDEYSANEFTVQRHTANRNRRVQDVEDDEDDE